MVMMSHPCSCSTAAVSVGVFLSLASKLFLHGAALTKAGSVWGGVGCDADGRALAAPRSERTRACGGTAVEERRDE